VSRLLRTDRVVVLVEPLGAEVVVVGSESLMRAAEAQGLHWPTVCGGDAECGACFVTVDVVDAAALPPPSENEQRGLSLLPKWRREQQDVIVRLACQLRPIADLTVNKVGVRLH
jgi:2Fe-2S ferredoxin